MKIISYNVNGIRAAIRKNFTGWLAKASPDVLCIQEIKANHEQIPVQELETLGYKHQWFSAQKKGYSGVGILSKKDPGKITHGMGIKKYDDEGRLMIMEFKGLSIINVYHPSGTNPERQEFKMKWLDDFYDFIQDIKKPVKNLIICGDFNICHKPIDIHDPVRHKNSSGFLPEEREWMSKFLESGFIDSFRYFNPQPHQYTWWSYRGRAREKNLGWRLDYNMVSNNLEREIKRAAILKEARHSDHCPVLLEI
jgi:exodeoxyribonuclease-3